jgi:hypothetical protein
MVLLGNKILLVWTGNIRYEVLCLHKNLAISIPTWAFNHLEITICFQDVGEINGVHVLFTIGIQTRMQLQSMILCGQNWAISMDATFSINDVKFHLLHC